MRLLKIVLCLLLVSSLYGEEIPDDPCIDRERWEATARKWRYEKENREKALQIYQKLKLCCPHNCDCLFFEGHILAHIGRWEEAKAVLKECLALAPQYTDAAVQLGNVYIWDNQLDQAESVLLAYQEDADAKAALARIAMRRGNYQLAEHYDREILVLEPENIEAREQLVGALVAQLKFREAKLECQTLVAKRPEKERHYRNLFEVKTHTDFSAIAEGGYTEAKENDPSLGVPVVKDYYSNGAVKLLFPIVDQWRLDGRIFLYRQMENSIYNNPGTNYDTFMTGGQVISKFFFAKDWRWDLFGAGYRATGRTHVSYPFIKRSVFEPGSYINYRSTTQTFVAGGHFESFVIKNFSVFRSEIQRNAIMDALYSYQLDFSVRPKAKAFASRTFYFDPFNRQDGQLFFLSSGIPFLSRYLRAFYFFEHRTCDQLTTSYFSFKKQWRHTLGMKLHVSIFSKSYIDLIYQHGNQMTHDLIQPIGDFIFVAKTQFLRSNKVIGRVGYRWKDHLKIEAEGHYFRDTLPYRDWNLQGSIQWQL